MHSSFIPSQHTSLFSFLFSIKPCATLATLLTLLICSCSSGFKGNYEEVKDDPLHTRIYTLDNGLRVYLSVNKDQPRIQANIAVRTGSRNDPAETTGLAHYLEHLMFKGTHSFGTSDAETEAPLLNDIEQRYEAYRHLTDPAERRRAYHEIDSVSQLAAQWNIPNEYDKLMAMIGSEGTNAYTSFDVTCYIEDIPANEVENWARIQADRFQDMVIRGFHTELEAVYEEYNLYLSDDNEKVTNALLNKLFPSHPYGTQTTIGTQEHLKNPSITNIKQYFHRYYCPNNVAICMSGDFDPDEVMDILNRYFGDWKANPELSRPEFPEMTEASAPTDTIVVGIEAESVTVGWRMPAAASTQADTLMLISEVLSNGKAGLLDLDINQRQLMMGAGASYDGLADYGAFILGGNPREGQTLEEARDLLLSELQKLKDGNFPEELLSAVIANMKLEEESAMEDNKERARRFVNAFVNNIEWASEIGRIKRLETITKQELTDFARRHLRDNYVCVYKRQGEDSTLKKIEKPEITPIPANRHLQSLFVKDMENHQPKPIEPVFVDLQHDLTEATTDAGTLIVYRKNTDNHLFTLTLHYPFGTTADKRLTHAASYFSLLGTDSLTAQEVQQQFYALACNFAIEAGPYQTSITLTGLDENLPKAIDLMQHVLTKAVADEVTYKAYAANAIKALADAKQEQKTCFSRLRALGTFGPRNNQRNILTPAELLATSPQDLVGLIRSLRDYEHTILYYGPTPVKELAKLLASTDDGSRPVPSFNDYEEQLTPQTEVWIAPYDAKNIYMAAYHNENRPWTPQEMPVAALFNEYFGAGMNGIVFQELRESRGLAYSAYAYYDQAPQRKGHPETSFTYIISQNDKMMDCINTFNQILDTLPQSQHAFDIAKQGLRKQLATLRTTRSAYLNAWLAAQERGIDYDINQRIYEAIDDITLQDIIRFADEHMARKPRRYVILGDEQELDMEALSKVGPIRRLTLQEIFGY